ncbi:MAG: tRNA (adenosine(37)-N6)-threonylcarbamoyltransferase complex ATPase subunit type 1 TsaE [Acidobacteria bacterium]|nr:tRNA (adenosine(37)-N6)-threonylcarbamoyltransferase complex ATPase subunit type 1 TsaE [Acidobacteriota bacterium]MCL5287392.1 tRNA (adenosine(37)-N6)-threonylcarbamoyltransferase complex ATPase subunit type 1 TsaE [Acidobacteriota bacterium]
MPIREAITKSTEETIALGRELAAQLRPPVLVCLDGELGAGKTTLAKGIISGLGVAREEEVTSPTFTLVHAFRNGVKVFHVDLYRVADRHDLETLGLEDLFAEPAIVLVEWPERMKVRTDWPVLRVEIENRDGEVRCIKVMEVGK